MTSTMRGPHVNMAALYDLSRKYDNVSTPTFVNDSRRKPGKKETYSDFYSIASVDAHHCHCIWMILLSIIIIVAS